jgi:hypothetical protein
MMSRETQIRHFDPDEWESHNTYYYKHERTGTVIHEETYKDRCIKHSAIQEYETEHYE